MRPSMNDALKVHLHGIVRRLDEDDDVLRHRAADALGVHERDIESVTLLKRSLDALGEPKFKCTLRWP